MDFDAPLFGSESFKQLLLRKREEGVTIKILLSHLEEFPLPEELQSEIEVISPVGSSGPWGLIAPQMDSLHHQKFMVIDETYLFFGGCLFTSYYLNDRDFHYIDSVLLYQFEPGEEAIVEYLKSESHLRPAPSPFLRERDHLEEIYRLIDGANDYIYVQNQYLVSNHYTNNQIFTRIKNRLLQRPDLKVIVVLNKKNYDHQEFLIRDFFPLFYLFSANYLSDNGANGQIKICFLKDGDRDVFIHDKIMIIDGVVLFTSANYVDRSLERDLELGILDRENGVAIEESLCRFLSFGRFASVEEVYGGLELTRLEEQRLVLKEAFYRLLDWFVYLFRLEKLLH
jgi:phosphatidylserine/phosphatidylglycerophosphate/cardiolipin synthase-like enzyme